MMRYRPAAVLLGLAVATGVAGPATADDWSARVDAVVQPFVRAAVFQGVVLVSVEGEVVYERAFGLAHRELDVPHTPAGVFQIASVSKPFTATAILVLAERGELDPHAPLSEILPDWPNGDRLTIDHLLTHTSGLPNVNSFPGYEEWSRFPQTTEEVVGRFRDRPLDFEPGTDTAYSNSNYNLLAYIIEKVSGRSYGEFLEEEVLRPAGMEHSGHRGDMSAIVPGLVTGYVGEGARGFARAPYLDWSIKTGNGSLYSTARDLLRFHRAWQDCVLLPPATCDEAQRVDRGMGWGWFSGERLGERRVYISGRSPGFTAHLERYPDLDRCFILLSNVYLSPPPPLLEGMAAVTLGREPPESDFRLGMAGDDVDLPFFAGRYRFGEDWFAGVVTARVEDRGDHLAVVYEDGTRPGYEFVLLPLGGLAFFDRTHGGLVRFEEEGGTATALIYEYAGEYRAPRVR
jgi:CubicO group peptidase (beta-lactamase class C family)